MKYNNYHQEVIIIKTLTEYRAEYDVTQKELGDGVGLSQETISQYESGTRTPNIIFARRIAKFFNVSLDAIIFGADISKRNIS